MKNFWIFISFIGLYTISFNTLCAQSDTVHLYQIYSSFSNKEKAEWTAFENNWNYFEYSNIKKTYQVAKLNCKNCESLYADLFIKIDEEGRFSAVQFMDGKKCGIPCREALFIEQFKNSLNKQQFRILKNKQFIARFGHILKC